MKRFVTCIFLLLCFLSAAKSQELKISDNGRFFAQKNGKPFFWLGDTGWLLFVKCNREEVINYLETRRKQGFNVVQVMVLHELSQAKNVYGKAALENQDVSKPLITPGNRFGNQEEYDYWDHVEWTIDEAARRGIYLALVPIWGSNVKSGLVSESQAAKYAEFLAARFKNKPNIIWLNGGDIKGSDGENIWKTLGATLRKKDRNHLMTFHPRGRTSSSEWFHQEKWLDFNMFQSGHKTYAQDNSPDETHHYGEDNWKYVAGDYRLSPVKPVLDGEPSYENIPQGLHDTKQPRWNDADVRRYAYWSVFAGGAGFTYGENSIMQFYNKSDKSGAFGADKDWRETLNSPASSQMQYLKNLMLSESYFDRLPAEELVKNQGARYDYIAATKGKEFAFFYTFNGREIEINKEKLIGKTFKCYWFNPRDGKSIYINTFTNKNLGSFDPPGEKRDGNDWVLIIKNK